MARVDSFEIHALCEMPGEFKLSKTICGALNMYWWCIMLNFHCLDEQYQYHMLRMLSKDGDHIWKQKKKC